MSSIMDVVLEECLTTLGPYLDQLVIAGGWVPYLYGKIYDGRALQEPLMTYDFDAVVPRRRFIEEGLALNDAILDAGFDLEFTSLHNPPVVKYVKELPRGARAEIEFITDEPGNREETKKIGSINAQALRHVGLLMDDPWVISLSELEYASGHSVRIPRPAAYIFHKVLTAPRRRQRVKTAKDLYYVFYVLDAFPAWKEASLGEVRDLARAHESLRKKACGYLTPRFSSMDSEGVDLLLSQKPQTTYPTMDDDQFRHYAHFAMAQLVDSLGE